MSAFDEVSNEASESAAIFAFDTTEYLQRSGGQKKRTRRTQTVSNSNNDARTASAE